jgi:hypothetical protein
MIVQISFTGLCAFVRNPSLKAMRVVLIAPSGVAPCDLHEPALLVPVSNWDQSINKRVPSEQFHDDEFSEDVVVLRLADEDLVFPAGSTSLSWEPPARSNPCPGADSASFDWIAKMREFTADGRMRDGILVGQPPAGVAARISITSGHFSTQSFRTGPDGLGGHGIIKFSITNAAGTTSRALAEELLMADSLSSPSGIYTIASTSFTGATNPAIMLHGNGSSVRFRVIDMPLDKIKSPASSQPFKTDDCFAEFYDLGIGAAGQVPVPVLTDLCKLGAGGLSNPKCPCVLFDDNANA